MKDNKVKLGVEIITSTDPSVQCIHALRQVMDHFSGKLSANGLDREAVYAWFVARHKTNPAVFK